MTDLASRSTPPAVDDDLVAEPMAAIERRLHEVLDSESRRWSRVDPELVTCFELVSEFIANGGKRLRPAFCVLAHLGVGGRPDDERLMDLGAALELLHTFALVHDDVMDGSDLRRHAPTVHRAMAARHTDGGWSGEQRRFGEGMAVLLGDLTFVYATRLTAGMPTPVIELFGELQIELHVGQYLDLLGAARGDDDAERADRVLLYKTAKYSVERPLHLGVALNGRLEALRDPLSRLGLAVGRAFQLRDDLLGALGEPAVTGKPIGEDFREGKRTALIHHARRWADEGGHPAAGAALDRLGQPDLDDEGVRSIQQVLVRSGAVAASEGRIAELMAHAEATLATTDMTEPARQGIARLARRCAWREA